MNVSIRPHDLIVLSVYSAGRLTFDRWVRALIEALASSDSVATGWEIVIGCAGDAEPDAQDLESAGREARAVGGAVSVRTLNPGLDPVDSLLTIVGGRAHTVILLDGQTLVLGTTVERMAAMHRATGGTVSARVLPLDGRTAIRHPPGRQRPLCALGSAEALSKSPVNADLCPEAVVVSNALSPQPPAMEGRSSLLERVLGLVSAADEPPNSVIEALGVEGDLSLSVIMRTQARRREALREVLLCLAAQTDSRFELVIVVHDSDPGVVEPLVAEQPLWLRERTRVLSVTGGTRSRPLNVGFAAARGSHLAVLDDDDLVTSEWVGAFLTAAARQPRCVLRAVVGVRHVVDTTWAGGIEGHLDESDLELPYPEVFHLVDHLRMNMTPFMAYAFPRAALERLGGADEALEVCEDWDLALRLAIVLGVVDIGVLTAIYRRWTSGRDSYSLHDPSVWTRDMARVRAKLDMMPIILPPGSASELAELSGLRGYPAQLADIVGSWSWRVTVPLRAASGLLRRWRRKSDPQYPPTSAP